MLNPTKSFLLGILAAVSALALELILSLAFSEKTISQEYYLKFTWLLLGVVLIEEIMKTLFIAKSFSFVKSDKIILNSFFVGIGFTVSELTLKQSFQDELSSSGFLSTSIVHMITCLIIGLNLFKQKKPSKWPLIEATIINIIIHLSYNLGVIYFF